MKRLGIALVAVCMLLMAGAVLAQGTDPPITGNKDWPMPTRTPYASPLATPAPPVLPASAPDAPREETPPAQTPAPDTALAPAAAPAAASTTARHAPPPRATFARYLAR